MSVCEVVLHVYSVVVVVVDVWHEKYGRLSMHILICNCKLSNSWRGALSACMNHRLIQNVRMHR